MFVIVVTIIFFIVYITGVTLYMNDDTMDLGTAIFTISLFAYLGIMLIYMIWFR